ncbi:hypothetical protein RFF05_11220 [Bengtsoniella intestinalis]|uniref:hypothetical protein n=1 Tax=Bengtsoniella intestinalis TaxID=3073143 RepID=UPI00391F74FF
MPPFKLSCKSMFSIVLIILILLLLAFIIIPLACGYTIGFLDSWKVTLENVYYIFSILGVFATVSAVYVAIKIPQKIADRQEKIALFEKRRAVYEDIEHFLFVSDILRFASYEKQFGNIKPMIFSHIQSKYGAQLNCMHIDSDCKNIEEISTIYTSLFFSYSGIMTSESMSIEVLFGDKAIADSFIEIVFLGNRVALCQEGHPECTDAISIFCSACTKFKRSYMPAIKSQLNLN